MPDNKLWRGKGWRVTRFGEVKGAEGDLAGEGGIDAENSRARLRARSPRGILPGRRLGETSHTTPLGASSPPRRTGRRGHLVRRWDVRLSAAAGGFYKTGIVEMCQETPLYVLLG